MHSEKSQPEGKRVMPETRFTEFPALSVDSKVGMAEWMDGWMTWDFTSFSTVFQSYQDDGRLIMKGCVQWNSVFDIEDFASSGDRTRAARSVGQPLTH